jgi:hypothetical protein
MRKVRNEHKISFGKHEGGEYLGIDGKVILKWISKKYVQLVTGFNCLMMGSSSGLL